MNANEIETILTDMTSLYGAGGCPLFATVSSVATFEEAGLLTRNRGVVLRMEDGSEFQITIVQSAPPRPGAGDNNEDEEGDQ